MLDKISKHGKRDITLMEYKIKLDWILKLTLIELIEMLKELGFRIKRVPIANQIIESNDSLLKEWKSKKMKWWKTEN